MRRSSSVWGTGMWGTFLCATVVALVLSLLPLWAPVAVAQEKSLVWENFDVDILVNPDGSFEVREHQTIRFTEGSFTFGYRDIPVINFDYIDNWSVTDSSGNTYDLVGSGTEPYTFVVEDGGRQYIIRWYFPPIANESETYTLSYTVHGGLRYYEGGDQVWWKAIYGDRTFPVLDGRVRVVVPDAARIQEWAAYINSADARDSVQAQLVEGSQATIFDLDRRLNPGQELEVRAEFTPGIVDGAAQPWQRAADEAAAQREAEIAYLERWRPIATLGFCVVGLLLGLGGPAGLYVLWYRYGRDKPVEMVADYLPEAPDNLAPGMAGTLLDETVDMQDILATIVDLARRKAISITEEKEEGFLRNRTDFVYRRENTDVDLLPYERTILDGMFGRKDEVRLSDLKNKFYTKISSIKQEMYESVVDAGYFPSSPESVRNRYGCFGVGLLILGIASSVALVSLFGDLTTAAVLPGVGLAIIAVGALIFSRVMPRKTEQGAEIAARWEAFKRYLENIDRYSDVEAQKEIWDRWLPYAIAFGIDKEYIRKFERVDAPAPGWYIPSPTLYGPYRRRYYGVPGPVATGGSRGEGGDFGGGRPGGGLGDMSRGLGTSLAGMSAGLGAMLTSANSTLTSRPSSSSSGGGWSGGGGGFSGGGSSGGGGGGGGGGGFG